MMRLFALTALAFVGGISAMAQGDRSATPQMPGRLVDIGGRRLHINCTGAGAPTVVLESGGSQFSIDWYFVQPEIAKTNRVCSYDRAGYAWSDPGGVETPQNAVTDLHALLRAAGERAPYVIVGASFGGTIARRYQAEHTRDVWGLVLVDPSHEDQLFFGVDGKPVAVWAITLEQAKAMVPSGDVPPQQVRPPQTGPPFDRLPPELLVLRAQFETTLMTDRQRPTRDQLFERTWGDVTAYAALRERRVTSSHVLGELPVVVLTRGNARDALQAAHADLAGQSTNSRHIVVPDAGHEIHLYRPDVVVQAIQDVARTTAGAKLP